MWIPLAHRGRVGFDGLDSVDLCATQSNDVGKGKVSGTTPNACKMEQDIRSVELPMLLVRQLIRN